MKDNATGSVKVTYFSRCVGDGPVRETNKCSGLRVGSRVQFTGINIRLSYTMQNFQISSILARSRSNKIKLILSFQPKSRLSNVLKTHENGSRHLKYIQLESTKKF